MKRKFIYFITALVMAFTLSIGGVGNSYIKAEASSGVLDPLWNTDASNWDNISRYLLLFATVTGAYIEPTLQGEIFAASQAADFLNFMLSDGYSEEEANAVIHGGGGFVRDGIRRDSDGNVTYSDEVSDLFYKYLCNFMDTENGYYVVETMSPEDFQPEWFSEEILYTNFVQTCKNLDFFYCIFSRSASTNVITKISFLKFSGDYFVLYGGGSVFDPASTQVYTTYKNTDILNPAISKSLLDYSEPLTKLSRGPLTWDSFDRYGNPSISIYFCRDVMSSGQIQSHRVISSDGRLLRVYKNHDALNNSNNKLQGFYISQQFSSYNVSNNNTVTLTNSQYQYYTDNSTTIYQNIQNNIDNTGTNLTDDEIRKIIDDTLKDFLDNMPEEEEKEEEEDTKDDDTGDDFVVPGGSVSGNGTGGNGLNDFVGGLGSLLDFLLSLFGKVIGLISDFLNSALELLGNLTSFTEGFSSFLAATFKFLPEEAITLICSGIALVITLGIIKYMRN